MAARAKQSARRAATPNLDAPPPPAVQVRAFVDAFERLGYDVNGMLADVGLARPELDDADALIPCTVTGALLEGSQQIRPLKNLWTRLAAETPLGAYKLLDYLILTSCDEHGTVCGHRSLWANARDGGSLFGRNANHGGTDAARSRPHRVHSRR